MSSRADRMLKEHAHSALVAEVKADGGLGKDGAMGSMPLFPLRPAGRVGTKHEVLRHFNQNDAQHAQMLRETALQKGDNVFGLIHPVARPPLVVPPQVFQRAVPQPPFVAPSDVLVMKRITSTVPAPPPEAPSGVGPHRRAIIDGTIDTRPVWH